MKEWNSGLHTHGGKNHKFDCKRCGTKSTHAFLRGEILSDSAESAEGFSATQKVPRQKESFKFLECSTCGGFSVLYTLFDITSGGLIKPTPAFAGSVGHDTRTIPREIKESINQHIVIPFQVDTEDIPPFLKADYNLMHKCFQVGSPQGTATHARRILDRIFEEFEKKHLTKEERSLHQKDIKKRAKIISTKDPFFLPINEKIKMQKGVVSAIIHESYESLAKDFKITPEIFKNLDGVILAMIEVYHLTFITFKTLEIESEEVDRMKKGLSK